MGRGGSGGGSRSSGGGRGFSSGGRSGSSFSGSRPLSGGGRPSSPNFGSRPSPSRPSGPGRPIAPSAPNRPSDSGPIRPNMNNRPSGHGKQMKHHKIRPARPPRTQVRAMRMRPRVRPIVIYPRRRRGIFYRRYYPHRHYYRVGGYRRTYYSMTFSSFLTSLGMISLIVGLILYFAEAMNFWNPLFLVGIGLLAIGTVIWITSNTILSKMRKKCDYYDDRNDYSISDHPEDRPTSSIPSSPQSSAPRRNKCPHCGAPESGDFCSFCGNRVN